MNPLSESALSPGPLTLQRAAVSSSPTWLQLAISMILQYGS